MRVFYDEKTEALLDQAKSLLDTVSQLIIDDMESKGLDPQIIKARLLEDPMRNELVRLQCDLRANATEVVYKYDRIDPEKEKAADAVLRKHGIIR